LKLNGNNINLSQADVFTTTCGTTPSKPINLTSQVSSDSVGLGWTMPACTYTKAVVRYRIQGLDSIGNVYPWKFIILSPYSDSTIAHNLILGKTYEWRIVVFDGLAQSPLSAIGTFVVPVARTMGSKTTAIEESNNFSVYPNPFEKAINVTIYLSKSSDISMELYDLQGKLIERTVKTGLVEGDNSINYQPNIQTNGVYILKVITQNEVFINRMMKN